MDKRPKKENHSRQTCTGIPSTLRNRGKTFYHRHPKRRGSLRELRDLWVGPWDIRLVAGLRMSEKREVKGSCLTPKISRGGKGEGKPSIWGFWRLPGESEKTSVRRALQGTREADAEVPLA